MDQVVAGAHASYMRSAKQDGLRDGDRKSENNRCLPSCFLSCALQLLPLPTLLLIFARRCDARSGPGGLTSPGAGLATVRSRPQGQQHQADTPGATSSARAIRSHPWPWAAVWGHLDPGDWPPRLALASSVLKKQSQPPRSLSPPPSSRVKPHHHPSLRL